MNDVIALILEKCVMPLNARANLGLQAMDVIDVHLSGVIILEFKGV